MEYLQRDAGLLLTVQIPTISKINIKYISIHPHTHTCYYYISDPRSIESIFAHALSPTKSKLPIYRTHEISGSETLNMSPKLMKTKHPTTITPDDDEKRVVVWCFSKIESWIHKEWSNKGGFSAAKLCNRMNESFIHSFISSSVCYILYVQLLSIYVCVCDTRRVFIYSRMRPILTIL